MPSFQLPLRWTEHDLLADRASRFAFTRREFYPPAARSTQRLKARDLMPKKNIFKLMPEIGTHMTELHAMLLNPDLTSYRIVMNPENMVIKEALRAQTYLNLFGYSLDAVVVNKMLPKGSIDPYLQALSAQQQTYYEKIISCFYPIPIFNANYYDSEVIGCERLAAMSRDLFRESDPMKVFYKDQLTQQILKENNKYHLKLYLPNVEIDRVQMNVKGDELMIEVNNFRKNIVLPNVLIGRSTESASYQNGKLDVVFS